MNIKILDENKVVMALIESESVVINDLQDAVDLLGNCDYQGASNIILKKEYINPDFFDLRTGMAGEILQKFSNYRKKLAIVGDLSNIESKSLRDFIYESNKTGRINFVSSVEEAKKIFSVSTSGMN